MPVIPCRKDGRPGFKYGKTGTCYTYITNNKNSRERAREKAEKQGAAIEISKKSKK